MSILIDEQYLRRTLADLVAIDSTNPSLTPGSPGEAEIGRYVATAMAESGLSVQVHEPAPGRVNVIGIRQGSGNGRSLLLNAHMDTVGVDGMADPFSGRVHEGRLYGRGSYDMKGSLAAQLAAARALAEGGYQLDGDLILAAVADEEYASLGTTDLVRHYRADAAIVTEPTSLQICRAHRGFIWFDVETFGRAAHGSRFEEGIDANLHMGRFLARLDQLEHALRHRPPHSLAGPPSLHAATLRGGTELSVYAAHCRLQIERRTAPGEILATVAGELQAILDELAAEDATFRASLKTILAREPFAVSPEADIVRVLEQVTGAHLGQVPVHVGGTFWTDAALLAQAGIPAVLFGPSGNGLHSAEEWVDLKSVLDLAYILAKTAVAWCL